MPNWFTNRLRVIGLAENVSRVQALMRGEVRPGYARAKGHPTVSGGLRRAAVSGGGHWLIFQFRPDTFSALA